MFSNKKTFHLEGDTVQKKSCALPFASFFRCFLRVSHFASVFWRFCRLSIFCTCQLGLPFVLQLRAGVGGGGVDVHASADFVLCFEFFLLTLFWCGTLVGRGDVHANAASVLCFSCCFVFCALVGWGHLFSGSTVPTLDFSHMLCI